MSADCRREAQQLRAKINLSDLVWLCVFTFCERAEVGLKFARVSVRFAALADKHFEGTKWSLGRLHIQRAENGENAEIVKLDDGKCLLPIPESAPPDNIIGFRRISISYVDHNVIAFLRQIRHLFEKETKIALDIRVNKKCVWALLARDIWPLLVGGISRLDCLSGVRFPDDQRLVLLRRHIASKALRDCAKLRVVECFGILPEAPADDRASATVGQALCMWLHTPLMDGRPKLLKCVAKDGQFLENVLQLKRSFVGTASPVSYIIRLSGLSDSDLEPFKLENHKTRERLSAQNVRHAFWLFERSPIVRDEKQWAVWEREAIGRKWWNSENNVLSLAIGPKDIGPLCDRPRRQRTAGHKGVDLMSVN